MQEEKITENEAAPKRPIVERPNELINDLWVKWDEDHDEGACRLLDYIEYLESLVKPAPGSLDAALTEGVTFIVDKARTVEPPAPSEAVQRLRSTRAEAEDFRRKCNGKQPAPQQEELMTDMDEQVLRELTQTPPAHSPWQGPDVTEFYPDTPAPQNRPDGDMNPAYRLASMDEQPTTPDKEPGPSPCDFDPCVGRKCRISCDKCMTIIKEVRELDEKGWDGVLKPAPAPAPKEE
jgi:hypothetical protein